MSDEDEGEIPIYLLQYNMTEIRCGIIDNVLERGHEVLHMLYKFVSSGPVTIAWNNFNFNLIWLIFRRTSISIKDQFFTISHFHQHEIYST